MIYLHKAPSGAGKSYEMRRRMFEGAARETGRSFLLIVPEQYTLETQRTMIAESPNGGIMNIDVLSFPRLAYRVFSELGVRQPLVLEDTGKSMIVKKVLLDKEKELGIYAGKIHRQGFIDEMKSIIAEFYQYGIDSDRFEQMQQYAEGRPQLAGKLHDIGVVYDGFRDFIDGRFIMNEELLDLLVRAVPQSQILKGSWIGFDGFTGFTVAQLRVIGALMQVGAEIHITLTEGSTAGGSDMRTGAGRQAAESGDGSSVACKVRTVSPQPDMEELFYLTHQTELKLIKLADECGQQIEVCDGAGYEAGAGWGEAADSRVPYRFRNTPSLAHLEKNIFRHPAGTSADSRGIEIPACDDLNAEMLYVIGEIRRLVLEEGYRYKDIAVITGDMAGYSRLAERAFRRAGIPCFMDSKQTIVGTGPVEMLRAALEAAEKDWSYESVFRFLKSGYGPLTTEETAKLENYCIALGIRGAKRWNSEWERTYRTRYRVDLTEINSLREKVAAALGPATAGVKGSCVKATGAGQAKAPGSCMPTVRERLGALRALLEACDVEARLTRESEERAKSADQDERTKARESAQLYRMILEVFERIGTLLGDDIIPLKEFTEILDTGFKEAKLALIPAGRDSVMFGDIERSRISSVKALFIVGVNDGIIPSGNISGGILSDADRSIFEENGIELSPTKRQSTYLSEFYLYLNMTKPSDRLYLTWHRTAADKRPGRPSYVIGRVRSMFPGLEMKSIQPDDRLMIAGTDMGRTAAARILRDCMADGLTDDERELILYTAANFPEDFARMLDAAAYRQNDEQLSRENAKGLYGSVLVGSVTLLEKYASCAFSHFLNYGLKLEDRPEHQITPLDLGNIYHEALELYAGHLKENGIHWHDATQEQRSDTVAYALGAVFEKYSDLLNDNKRSEYVKTRVTRVLNKTVSVIHSQVEQGRFEPASFEEQFNTGNEFMRLNGKIDRMDICERGGKKYLRVIDYKSGHKDFDLVMLYHGLQIQLTTYLKYGLSEHRQAADGRQGEVVPAGMYYYNIDDPIIDITKSPKSADDPATAQARELKLRGLTNRDPDCVLLQDESFLPEDGPDTDSTQTDSGSAKAKSEGSIEDDPESEELPLRPSTRSGVIQVATTKDKVYSKQSKVETEEHFGALIEHVDRTMAALGAGIMAGEIPVNPYRRGDRSPCTWCTYKGICNFESSLGSCYRELGKEKEEDIWARLSGAQNSKK